MFPCELLGSARAFVVFFRFFILKDHGGVMELYIFGFNPL